MSDTVVLDGELNLTLALDGGCAVTIAADGDAGVAVEVGRLPVYDGPTEVTPTQEAQVLATNQTQLRSNITIAPIPENWCRFSWDGSIITIE